MMTKRFASFATLTLVVLLGLWFFPLGIRNLVWFFKGRIGRSNFPGTILATPAWCLLLPVALLSIWKRASGAKLVILAGLAGSVGTLTMPCAWEKINRSGFATGAFFSAAAAAFGYLLLLNGRSDSAEEK